MDSVFSPAATYAALVSVLCVVTCYYAMYQRRKLPPGPPRLPIIGNVHQLTSHLWLSMTEWVKVYGPLVYLSALGRPIVVLGSHKVAHDLLDRRAGIYSDRPRNIVAGELMTKGHLFPLSSYTTSYKRMHQSTHQAIGVRVYRDYFPIQERESLLLISSLLVSPNDFTEQLKRATASMMISVIYGVRSILDPKDRLLLLVDGIGEAVTQAALPGAYFVEFLPWMMHLPRWMCPWRIKAENWYTQTFNDLEKLLQDVADRERSGVHIPCAASNLLNDLSKGTLTKEEAIWTAGTIYAAGAETTAGQMMWFMLAMVLHPSVQKRAQTELDHVVGRSRLPSFKDLPQLPFIRAIAKEVFRWRPVAPMGVPHRLTTDDSYEGYDLPKGSICIVNVWGLNQDPEVYGDDAHEFKPERFLDQEGRLIDSVSGGAVDTKREGHVSYGFGPRMCVGRHIANSSLFIKIATILWAFDILPQDDELGDTTNRTRVGLPIDANASDAKGIVAIPKVFGCSVVPRFEGVRGIVREDYDNLMGDMPNSL